MQQHSKSWNFLVTIALVAFATALGLLLAPGARAEMYEWRTEDGGYAYTDDLERVPARYAPAAQRIDDRKLADYERFTPQDDAASRRYAARLAERLSYLRAMNAPARGSAPHSAAATVPPQRTISLSTGDDRAPEISVPVGTGMGPIVVEPVSAKRSGQLSTRRVTVIRQGDETLAVIKGSRRHVNPIADIHDEEELEAGAPLR
jgi:hypothetical protein